MTQTRRRFPESFKREAVDQVLAGTPLRHVAETLGIAESLLGKWKRQYEQQGDDAFPGNGKQRGESAELRRLRRQLGKRPGKAHCDALSCHPLGLRTQHGMSRSSRHEQRCSSDKPRSYCRPA
ncbi:transposase [Pseudomonas aeruginosa]|nr:transposase [Pseudomonas aeruginosa]